jgi:hypothetical protein
MQFAEVFQQTEQLWAENAQARHELGQSTLESERSLNQLPDFQTSAQRLDARALCRRHVCREGPPDRFNCDA